MSITSYFFPISKKDKGKQASNSSSPTRTVPEGKSKSRSAPYPNNSGRKSSSHVPDSVSPLLETTSSTSNPDTTSFTTGDHPRYVNLKSIADDTIQAIEKGSYELDGTTYDLQVAVNEMRESTEYWSPNAKLLADWALNRKKSGPSEIDILLFEISTLEGAKFLESVLLKGTTTSTHFSSSTHPKIGLLNFASATKPGGGFLGGASAQEESIARSSTLYYSLTTRIGEEFYKLHKRLKVKGKFQRKGHNRDAEEEDTEDEEDRRRNSTFYTHAMIYSPSVLLFRDDAGSWHRPIMVDILTSAAVNAGDVRTKHRAKNMDQSDRDALESRIREEMKERMARILHLFTLKGVRNLVLGSFGTGVFKNNVDTVAGLWKELLVGSNAPFHNSFDRVVFAVLGRETFETFQKKLKLNARTAH